MNTNSQSIILDKQITMKLFLVLAAFILSTFPARAENISYLNALHGEWKGSGVVKVKASLPEVPVDCAFKSSATENSLRLDGLCRALLVITKAVTAKLDLNEGAYSGTYIGARTGPAGLQGTRTGNSINLKISWAGEVNGDTMASMAINKTGENTMILEISDIDPGSGENITTSRFHLTRQ